jgi:hypothetical protein
MEKKEEGKLVYPLEYETDNRDASETWLQVSTDKKEYLGYISLMVEDMFGLIRNVLENNPGMDTSEIENEIEKLKFEIYHSCVEEKGDFDTAVMDAVDTLKSAGSPDDVVIAEIHKQYVNMTDERIMQYIKKWEEDTKKEDSDIS